MDKARHSGSADEHYNRGNALQRAGNFAQALASYDAALAIRPDWVEALTNRGVALRNLKRAEDAVESYDSALALQPTYVLALINRGNALRDLGRHHQALASFEKALVLAPDNLGALLARAMLVHDLGQHVEALRDFDRLLRAAPDDPDLLNLRGNTLRELNRLAQALTSYSQAIAARPDFAGALYNRANVLKALRRHDGSLADYDRALKVQPNFADALNNRGNLLLAMRRNAEAARDFAALVKLAPDYPYARGKLMHARMRLCDWTSYKTERERICAEVDAGKRSTPPQEMLTISDSTGEQLRCARIWTADQFPPANPVWSGERYAHDKIRIGYLSAELHDHAVGYLLAGIVENHDRHKFEISAFSLGPENDSATRARLIKSFGHFHDVREKSDVDIAQLVRAQEIDILIDLNGHTGESRTGILAHRPAPVQVNFLGYSATMGADYVDYIIADRVVIPDGQQARFAEKIVWLPSTFFPADDKCAISETTPSRASQKLPEEGFVFCAFNNSYKITPDIFGVWMELLCAVDGSVLWLSDPGEAARGNLCKEAEARGVTPARLVFAQRTPERADHIARQRLADLFLDTAPYNAHTTSCDALLAGLPVLTCRGESFASRVASSLLTAAGLPELITSTRDEYRDLALWLAHNPQGLAKLKAKLARNRDAGAFDTARYTRHLEAAFVDMHRRVQAGSAADHIVV
jgi:predicted O-linked N-acetylglucosamine transferase (SPINDLY family)